LSPEAGLHDAVSQLREKGVTGVRSQAFKASNLLVAVTVIGVLQIVLLLRMAGLCGIPHPTQLLGTQHQESEIGVSLRTRQILLISSAIVFV
jgi:precorrin-4 methylase